MALAMLDTMPASRWGLSAGAAPFASSCNHGSRVAFRNAQLQASVATWLHVSVCAYVRLFETGLKRLRNVCWTASGQ